MLYLGNTLYACWEELGRPNLNDVWVSAFRLRQDADLRVVDFGYRPGYVAQILEQIGQPQSETPVAKFIVAYAVIWPIIAASSFRALHRGKPFVEEYIIPQQLMSWVAESDRFVGVRYFSTHVVAPPTSAAARNIVLPAKDMADAGYCAQLSNLLESTQPVQWSLAAATGELANRLTTGGRGYLLVGGKPVPYEWTDFARMEETLKALTFGPPC